MTWILHDAQYSGQTHLSLGQNKTWTCIYTHTQFTLLLKKKHSLHPWYLLALFPRLHIALFVSIPLPFFLTLVLGQNVPWQQERAHTHNPSYVSFPIAPPFLSVSRSLSLLSSLECNYQAGGQQVSPTGLRSAVSAAKTEVSACCFSDSEEVCVHICGCVQKWEPV